MVDEYLDFIKNALKAVPSDFWLALSLSSLFILFFIPWYLKNLPEDYFIQSVSQRPTRVAYVFKNLVAVVFFVGGVLMLFLPGQGLLTLLAALCIGEYPGKSKLVSKITQSEKVRSGLDKFRRRVNAKPFLWK